MTGQLGTPDEASETVIDLRDRSHFANDVWASEWRDDNYLAGAIDGLRREHNEPAQPFGVYFIDGSDPRSSLGRSVEQERFGDEYGNDITVLRSLYGEFEVDRATELIVVVDHVERRPAGVIRTIRNTAERGCRMLNDLQMTGENGWGLSWDEITARSSFAANKPESITEIATIAVAKRYQGARSAGGVSKALYAALLQRALGSQANTWVCLMERIPYLLVQAIGKDVMNEFDGVDSRPYHGAPDTIPVWANFREYEAYLGRAHPDSHDLLVKSAGLLDQYYFGFPGGAPTWDPLDPDVIDLRMYESVPHA